VSVQGIIIGAGAGAMLAPLVAWERPWSGEAPLPEAPVPETPVVPAELIVAEPAQHQPHSLVSISQSPC